MQHDLTGDHIRRTGGNFDFTNRADDAMRHRHFPHLPDQRRGHHQCILAAIHGGGAGMVGIPRIGDQITADADNPFDDPDFDSPVFQPTPLFDMQF